MIPPAVEPLVLALAFASLRTGAALALLPALGGQLIPVRVRIGLAGAVGWLVVGSGAAAPSGPGPGCWPGSWPAPARDVAAGDMTGGAAAGGGWTQNR